MKTLEIIGFKRANLGKAESKRLRNEANVPCVLYGDGEQVYFYSPMILFRDLVYTPNVHTVELNVEGKTYRCILQDIQFHPVNEVILHADFLLLNDQKEVKMEVPVRLVGTSPGVQKGGKLVTKLSRIKVSALPAHLPDFIEVDVTGLELGKSVKVGEIKPENYAILNSPLVTVATVAIPRALKGKQGQ